VVLQVTWDGHTSSVEAATRAARANITLEDQIHQIHKVKGLLPDEEKEKIGPKPIKGRDRGERDRERERERDREREREKAKAAKPASVIVAAPKPPQPPAQPAAAAVSIPPMPPMAPIPQMAPISGMTAMPPMGAIPPPPGMMLMPGMPPRTMMGEFYFFDLKRPFFFFISCFPSPICPLLRYVLFRIYMSTHLLPLVPLNVCICEVSETPSLSHVLT